jgi:prepilin-type N-terminal cleavage/methylation domain-containing protein
MLRKKAFTLIELLVVISIIALLIGILLPALGAARRTARQMQNSTQVRGIQTAFVLYAQGNNNFYPGFNGTDVAGENGVALPATGNTDGAQASTRLAICLYGNYFTGDYEISPVEVKNVWTTGIITTANFSYNLLQIGNTATTGATIDSGRRAEWSNTINTQGNVLADRSKRTDATLVTTSLYVTTTTTNVTDWRGSVGWNDNHVTFETTSSPVTTKYGVATNNTDDIFSTTTDGIVGSLTATTANSLMVYY